ncbi:MAG: formyltransferase family protein [Planctomycetota bacterium]
MRIAVVTQEEPFVIPGMLHALYSGIGKRVVATVILPSFNQSPWGVARRLYGLYGPGDFARLAVRYALAMGKAGINRFHPWFHPGGIRDVSRRFGIPAYRPRRINDPDFLDVVRREIRPDLLVSVAASQKLGRDLLSIPSLGGINLHSAPLPRYRGMMPSFWAMLNGETETAVTVHVMTEEIDGGDILVQEPVRIDPANTLHDLIKTSKMAGVGALLRAIDGLERGVATRKPMDLRDGSYFSFPTREDAARFRKKGLKLL